MRRVVSQEEREGCTFRSLPSNARSVDFFSSVVDQFDHAGAVQVSLGQIILIGAHRNV
jgi:hypothetical protein